MDFKDYFEKLWYKIIYALSVIVYLVFLNKLNKELLSYSFSSSFDLLAYNEHAALKYFGIAVILFGIGCYLIYREIRSFRMELDYFEEMIIAICTIAVIIILLILIIVFIDNPILRAILTAALTIGIFVAGATN